MDDKSAIDTMKEKVKFVVAAAKTRLAVIAEGTKSKPKIFAAQAKEKLGPLVEEAKTKKTHLSANAKTKFIEIKGQAEAVQEHPKVKSYIGKLKDKGPLKLGGMFAVAAFCLWFTFIVLGDTKPSDALLFETITSDGGNGLVYDTKILARDGFEEGNNKYVVEVAYEITWKMNQEQAMKTMMELAYKEMKAQGLPEYQIKMELMFGGFSVALLPLLGEKPFKVGDRKKMTDTYTFVKAESGWRLVNDD